MKEMEKHRRVFTSVSGMCVEVELQGKSGGLFFWEYVDDPPQVNGVTFVTGETNLVSETLEGKIYSYIDMPPDVQRLYGEAIGHPFP
jgi:hypothetical protein